MARIAIIAGVALAGAAISVATGGLGTFAVGAWAADIIAGAAVGAAVGSVLSAVIFPPNNNGAPPLNSLQGMSSSYGSPIAWGYGGYVIAGQVIWESQIQVHQTQQSSGGKGGPTSTVYTYTVSAAISFGFGPGNITRIWADTKLIYDATAKGPIAIDTGLSTTGKSTTNAITTPFEPTFYSGTADQLPDPTVQAAVGVNNCSGYRDQIYMVINNFPLADFADRLPNFRAEVSTNTELAYIKDIYPESLLSGPAGISGATFTHIDNIGRAAYVENQSGQVVQKIDLDVNTGTPADPWQNDTVYVIGNEVLDTNGNIQYCIRNHTSQATGIKEPPWETGEMVITEANGLATWQEMGPGPNVIPIVNAVAINEESGSINNAGLCSGTDTAGNFWTQIVIAGKYYLAKYNPQTLAITSKVQLPVISAPQVFTRVKSGNTATNYLYVTGDSAGTLLVINADLVSVVFAEAWTFPGQPDASIAVGGAHPPVVDPVTGNAYLLMALPDAGTGILVVNPVSGTITTIWSNTYTNASWGGGVGDIGTGLFWDPSDNTLLMITQQGFVVKISSDDGTVIAYTPTAIVDGAGAAGVVQAKGYDTLVPQSGTIYLWASNGGSGSFVYLNTSNLSTTNNVLYSNWLPSIGSNVLTWFAYDALTDSAVVCAVTSEYADYSMRLYFNRMEVAEESLQDVVEDIWNRTGAASDLLDASALADIQVEGYPITQGSTGKGLLGPLCAAYFFDLVESDNVLKAVLRGQSPSTVIPETDLGLINEPETEPKIVQQHDLPLIVDVTYYDIALDYQNGKQTARRNKSVKKTRNRTPISLPLALQADEAAAIAQECLQTAWAERNQWLFKLWRRSYLIIDPTDVVQFTYNGNQYQARIGKTSVGANAVIEVTAVSEDPRQYLTPAANSGFSLSSPYLGFIPPTISTIQPSVLFILDIPYISDTDANPTGNTGYYWLMAGAVRADNWAGGLLYQSLDNNTFNDVGIQANPVLYGGVAIATPFPPVSLYAWDFDTVINVQMSNSAVLTSASMLSVLNGANWFYLSGEIMAFANATLQANGSYNLSTLLRGLRGTEGACALHQANETLIMLGADKHQSETTSIINATQYFRGVTLGQPYTTAVSNPVTLEGNDLKPYAPAQFTGTIDGSSNINISWVRRTRLGGAWLDGIGTVPLSEESESYDLEICNGNSTNLVHYVSPLAPLQQRTLTQPLGPILDTFVQPFIATWEDGTVASYLGFDFGNLSSGTYYVTVHDPGRIGETISAPLTYLAESSPLHANKEGYTVVGVIVITTGVPISGTNGGSPLLLRTVSGLTSPMYQYTESQQVADFGTAQAFVYARVYQNSATVGRGFPATNPTIGATNVISGGSNATSILGVNIAGTPVDGDLLQYNVSTNEWQIVGPLLKRQTIAETTSTLANNAAQTGSLTINCGTFALLQVQVDRSSRVQFYSTAAFRDADTRAYGVPPSPAEQNGIIADFGLGGAETWVCSPPVVGANADSSPSGVVYYRITNLSGSTSTVTVTLTIVPLEVAP